MDSAQLTHWIRGRLGELGFDTVGIAPAVTPPGYSRFEDWLDRGFAGEMEYLAARKTAYQHPGKVMDGAVSVVMMTLNYFTRVAEPAGLSHGKIARYAWGSADYHDLVHSRFKDLKRSLKDLDLDVKVRGVVDTAPLLEREFARLAGVGWFGKNTMMINKYRGSWFLLAALLVDRELVYDQPHQTDHCGTCTACLTACPTDAFPEPGVLDATRCISYLTIEHRTPIALDLRESMGDWILGCDVCQDVCPWNRKAVSTSEVAFEPLPGQNPLDLLPLFQMSDEDFRRRFRKTPLWRPRRRGLLRNAAIVLGNQMRSSSTKLENGVQTRIVQSLALGLQDEEPLVRGASAWALGQVAEPTLATQCQQWLSDRVAVEKDEGVLEEVELALANSRER